MNVVVDVLLTVLAVVGLYALFVLTWWVTR
jgi:hypothetical protein